MEPVSRLLIVAVIALLAHVGMGCTRSSKQASVGFELSPARWPQQDRDRYLALQRSRSGSPKVICAENIRSQRLTLQ